ncbi:LLM class flavin-dependent oxidoreductase [Streptomyces sp. NBC_01261]|uniref:LLM class flavin-dependent oxidoreductase n=1 Tax=unclassified Streptomyces TaxID=2593676 RepID=UPI002E3437E8|nr:LLM class flavin-dependent oxidoreductase [Streptomyces sp. NBC_01261]
MATGVQHYGLDCEEADFSDKQFVREELERWVLAEELGLDSVWITEHHFTRHSLAPDPLMYLSYLAGRTRRIRLGTQVLVLPWHDPVRVAEQIILLDHVSNGRAIIGFGRGMAPREYRGLRIDQATSRERYDEMLELVVQGLRTGVMEGGELFQQPRVELRPRPSHSFEGRLFGAFGSPSSQQQAGKLGMGQLVTSTLPFPLPPGGFPKDAYLEAWRESQGPDSQPPAPFASSVVVVDESADRAQEIARQYGGNSLRVGIWHYEQRGRPAFGPMPPMETDEDVERAVDGFVSQIIAGTPDQVLKRLEEVRDQNQPQGLFPQLFFGGMPNDESVRNMRCFAEHCVPEIKSWPAPSSIDVDATESSAVAGGEGSR